MNETALYFWLGQAIVLVAGFVTGYTLLVQRIAIIETKQSFRDRFFEDFERRALELLHRDDNKFALDKLVEKYRINHYDLPKEDWLTLKYRCEEIFEDKTNPTEERLLASLAIGLAEHKLQVLSDRKPLLR